MKHKKLIITLSIILIIFLSMGIALGVYVNDYYHSSDDVDVILNQSDVNIVDNKYIVFMPKEVKAGLIFYPGGKVEYDAYAPLLDELKDEGILCILVKMPFNLAVFGMNKANKVYEEYMKYTDNWYLAGHSLGGAMAASYLANNHEKYDGLFLLGAYSTSNLCDTNLDVSLIYGSLDLVMNKEKYESSKSNLPLDYNEYIIKGGCHAYFGSYGNQANDGSPTITRAEQIDITCQIIVDEINN